MCLCGWFGRVGWMCVVLNAKGGVLAVVDGTLGRRNV